MLRLSHLAPRGGGMAQKFTVCSDFNLKVGRNINNESENSRNHHHLYEEPNITFTFTPFIQCSQKEGNSSC